MAITNGLAAKKSAPSLSPEAAKVFQTARSRVQPFASTRLLWQRFLTDEEREQLGSNLDTAFRQRGTAGIWTELHGVSSQRAVCDVAVKLGHLTVEDYGWLLQQLGEQSGGIVKSCG